MMGKLWDVGKMELKSRSQGTKNVIESKTFKNWDRYWSRAVRDFL